MVHGDHASIWHLYGTSNIGRTDLNTKKDGRMEKEKGRGRRRKRRRGREKGRGKEGGKKIA